MTSLLFLDHIRRHGRRLRRDCRGLAMLEFGLILPVFLTFCISGLEFGYYVMACNRVQRMASMTADLVAQSGIGSIGATEGQIYDLFSAVDLTAQPYDLRKYGRVIISSVKGTDINNDAKTENRFLWQRFDGDFTGATPLLGCAKTNPLATIPQSRVLPLDEILFHVQVTYSYQPLFGQSLLNVVNLNTTLTRTATYRARSSQFQSPTADPKFPPKNNCASANGL